MTIRRLSRLLLLCLFFLPQAPCLHAELVDTLYEGEAAVSGQSGESRAEGIKQAFAQVLVKVSGERGLLTNPQIDTLLSRASSFVQQYRFRPLEDGSAAAPQADRLLWARFDERAVNRLLRESGVPVWGATRPSVLLWLGEESGPSRSLLSLEQQPRLKATISRVAKERGLPLLLPLMDMEDRNALPVSDLWGGFESDIRRASERYLPDVILVARLSRLGGEWRGEWLLYLPDRVDRWQGRAGTMLQLAEEGLQQAADALARRFAPQQASEGGNNLRIRIHGLASLADYVLVRDYLQSLAMIERLDLLAAGPDQVSFLARVQGGREVLERGIQLGAVLEPMAAPEPEVGEGPPIPEDLDAESLDYHLR
jgi:hypothetical protein